MVITAALGTIGNLLGTVGSKALMGGQAAASFLGPKLLQAGQMGGKFLSTPMGQNLVSELLGSGDDKEDGQSSGGNEEDKDSLLEQIGHKAGSLGKAVIPQLGKVAMSNLLSGGQSPGMMQAPQIGTPDINTDFSQNRLNRRFM